MTIITDNQSSDTNMDQNSLAGDTVTIEDIEDDRGLADVPIENAEAGASLPAPEEIRSSIGAPPRKSGNCWMIAVAVVVALAIIIGVSVGVTQANQSTNSSASKTWDDDAVPKSGSGSDGNVFIDSDVRQANLMDVIDYVHENGVAFRDEMMRTGTPQNLAAIWLAETDERNMAVPDGHDITSSIGYHYLTRYILAVVWYSMGGDNWQFQTNFMSQLDECNWHDHLPIRLPSGAVGFVPAGVYCDDTTGDVYALHLDYNNLQGTIPKEIGHLTTLKFLALEGNAVEGNFIPELCKMKGMIALTMMQNQLEGTIPKCIQEMSDLLMLVLSNNGFTEELPDLSMITGLQYLFLDDNQLTGDLTDTFNKMSDLKVLYLDDNDFSGFIGENFLANSPQLQRVDISGNSFTGSFPGHVLGFQDLQVLDIHGNRLEGNLPEYIPVNENMRLLAFYENEMKGTIPRSITNLTKLFHFDASKNHFFGDMPTFLGEMTDLSYLYLAHNAFNAGPIPSAWANLTQMQELSLKSTNRTGPIPSFIGDKYNNLILLDLDNNDFSGNVPANLGYLPNLEFMLLNRNQKLQGNVPESFVQLTNLRTLMMDRTNITGSLQGVCLLPNIDEPAGDADGTEYLTADCSGDRKRVDCPCCKTCCDPETEAVDCHVDDEIANLAPEWEYVFNRYDYDFGSNNTFFPDRRYINLP